MKNILVTDFDGGSSNVIVFTENLNAEHLETYFTIKEKYFTDIVEVKDEDLQYYVYDPLWMDMDQERNVLKHVTEKVLNELDPKTKVSYLIISPDGFSTHWDDYSCNPKDFYKDVKYNFNNWMERFEKQGYYSSNEKRIPLSNLAEHCTIQLVVPEPDKIMLPVHRKKICLIYKSII